MQLHFFLLLSRCMGAGRPRYAATSTSSTSLYHDSTKHLGAAPSTSTHAYGTRPESSTSSDDLHSTTKKSRAYARLLAVEHSLGGYSHQERWPRTR